MMKMIKCKCSLTQMCRMIQIKLAQVALMIMNKIGSTRSRFQASSRYSHLKATKRILRYLKHTQNVSLWYPKGAKFELVGYSNSDYVGCKVERKSTTGTCQLLERSLVLWSSKKQNSVALSTADWHGKHPC